MEGRRKIKRTTSVYRRATATSTKQKMGTNTRGYTYSTGVASEQRRTGTGCDRSDVRNNAKAPCVEGRLGVEDSMD
jgi:hypothetical protein